jgi:hypothetical protein
MNLQLQTFPDWAQDVPRLLAFCYGFGLVAMVSIYQAALAWFRKTGTDSCE